MDLSRRAQLATLLTYGAEALDLTPTQYQDAVQKYQAVGAWLNKPDSPLAAADPLVYPQGSIAIGTATKPVGRDEFDLDLVCQLQLGDSISPTSSSVRSDNGYERTPCTANAWKKRIAAGASSTLATFTWIFCRVARIHGSPKTPHC